VEILQIFRALYFGSSNDGAFIKFLVALIDDRRAKRRRLKSDISDTVAWYLRPPLSLFIDLYGA
jgi:hypothetical protein